MLSFDNMLLSAFVFILLDMDSSEQKMLLRGSYIIDHEQKLMIFFFFLNDLLNVWKKS